MLWEYAMTMRCPVCGTIITYADNPYRPFCSTACKGKDFLKWVGGEYRIPSQPDETDAAEGENNG